MDYIKIWLDAKQAESDAVLKRREAEDAMMKEFNISESLEGTTNKEFEGYQVKIIGRMTRKIDADLLQEVAAENGISEQLSSLFRWKPEIDSKAWKAADSSITTPLLAAITKTPGRASFSITIKE